MMNDDVTVLREGGLVTLVAVSLFAGAIARLVFLTL